LEDNSAHSTNRRKFDSADTALGASVGIEAPAVALSWFIRLRWIALAGQTFTLATLYRFSVFEALPYWALAGMIALTAFTNLVLSMGERRLSRYAKHLLPGLLVFDTLMLTGMLHMSGGIENPFSLFFIVHVAMAAVALNLAWTSFMVLLTSTCFGGLFFWSHLYTLPSRTVLGISLRTLGVWVSVSLVSMVIAYFIQRISLELRRRQLELVRVRDLIARNERLASLTTLAAGAAHELGTPLGTIAMVAHEMERPIAALADAKSLGEDLRLIRSQVDRCRGILDRMSVRDEEGSEHRLESIELTELEKQLREQLGKRARLLEFRSRDEVGPIRACRQDLLGALIPLIKNGMDASREEAPVVLEIDRDGGLLRFSVIDRGTGMSPNVLARVGEPFYTTKALGKGMGLGLYLVRLFAERLGGKFEVESENHVGTRAILEFPE